MSARTRWWLGRMVAALPLLALAPVFAILHNWPALIVSLSYVVGVYFLTSSARYMYRAGWYAGRVSMHLDVHDIDPEPWDDLPPRAPVDRVSFPAFVVDGHAGPVTLRALGSPELEEDDLPHAECDCKHCRDDRHREAGGL